jgi:hypothetical protein
VPSPLKTLPALSGLAVLLVSWRPSLGVIDQFTIKDAAFAGANAPMSKNKINLVFMVTVVMD